MGRTMQPPPALLGCAVPRGQILLYLGRLARSRQMGQLDPLYQNMGYEGERARAQLIAAEAARRQADAAACRQHLQAASAWILHSGSVEHLCLFHLVRTRVAGDAGEGETAQRAMNEGLHLSRVCGLELYHIELLCVQAEINLALRVGVPSRCAGRRVDHEQGKTRTNINCPSGGRTEKICRHQPRDRWLADSESSLV